MSRGTGAPLVLVTPDTDEALLLGDRVALLAVGRAAPVRDVPRPRDRGALDDPARAPLRRAILSSLGIRKASR
ncbi:ABC transporter ATP-binding protein [Actinobacteria bacterium OK074]|nr:ABC transporter ATP-binding protein [Actinobacteria bacterium OK074]